MWERLAVAGVDDAVFSEISEFSANAEWRSEF
jgi:hypothetical protein